MKKEIVRLKCKDALDKIEQILLKPKEIEECNISKSALLNIKYELEIMTKILDKHKYLPAYSRFLLDYPESDLINFLIETAYLYKQKT
jgi:hypothetical protein